MTKAIEILRDRLSEDSVEFSYDNIDGIPTLRLVLDSMGEDESGIVILELSGIPLEEEDRYGYFHFLSVVANKLEAGQIQGTLKNLNRINTEVLLGSFQIVEEAGTVVHKYVFKTVNDKPEETAEDLYNCLVDIVAVINNDYDNVLAAIE